MKFLIFDATNSAGASLGVTWCAVVIPTGATNAVRSGTEESLEYIDLFILSKNSFFQKKG